MSQEKHIIRELTRLCRLVELASDQPILNIEAMSDGLTNHNYKIVGSDGLAVAARIPGEGTEEYIDRAAENTTSPSWEPWVLRLASIIIMKKPARC